jgi:hypothetical protein
LLEYEHDIERVKLAFKQAEKSSLPVAVLVGVEYAEESGA